MSRVGDLPAVPTASSFTVTWSGSDEGAGLNTFAVFVSDNGGPFTLLLTDTPGTSAIFNGQAGHAYASSALRGILLEISNRSRQKQTRLRL